MSRLGNSQTESLDSEEEARLRLWSGHAVNVITVSVATCRRLHEHRLHAGAVAVSSQRAFAVHFRVVVCVGELAVHVPTLPHVDAVIAALEAHQGVWQLPPPKSQGAGDCSVRLCGSRTGRLRA